MLLLVLWLAWVAYELWSLFFLGIWGALFWGLVMALAIGVAAVLARSHRRTDESMLRLSSPAVLPDQGGLLHHRPKLIAELIRAAVLVDRAGIELMHGNRKADLARAGIARRRTLDAAKTSGTWDGLQPAEQDLLLSQEGSWDPGEAWSKVLRVEDVRVLRWVLGIDSLLSPLEFTELDLRPALDITANPNRTLGTASLEPADLRPAKMLAGNMLDRLLAEGVWRGFYRYPEDETRARLIALADRLRENKSGDLLVGTESVGEASEERIRLVMQTALRRFRVLEAVIGYLTGPYDSELLIDRENKEQEASSVPAT